MSEKKLSTDFKGIFLLNTDLNQISDLVYFNLDVHTHLVAIHLENPF